MPVYAPSSIQEMVDLITEAFDVADQYRTPVMIMGDGMLGQMMEPVEFRPSTSTRVLPEKTWAANGRNGRAHHNVINSLFLKSEELEMHNDHLGRKYDEITKNEVKYELMNTEDADLIMVAYGTTARICKNTIKLAKEKGINLGLIRPITLWPYPQEAFDLTIGNTKHGYLAVEMSKGQMVEDVRLSVEGRKPVHFYGRSGGMVPSPEEILDKAMEIVGGNK
jgi:2-oxoglutarate ferredoxin oxidoreductase subunit alpha